MIKVYAIAILIALIGLAIWRYNYVVKDRDQLKANLELATFVSNQYKESVESQAKDLAEYQTKLDEKLNENSTLRDAVMSNRKQLRIRATCDSTETASAGTAQTATISDPQLRSDILNFRAKLILLEANYALCLKELN